MKTHVTPEVLAKILPEMKTNSGKPQFSTPLEQAEQEILLCRKNSIEITIPGDSDYPSELNDGSGPDFIEYLGNPEVLNNRTVTIVGSRAASKYGMDLAFKLSEILAREGFCIISGGAYGIDGAAHRGAVAAKGFSGVFLGGGILKPYPDRHIPLFKEIIKLGGVVMSFVPATFPLMPWVFLRRNRYMAQASMATVVCEAQIRSGSLSTARHAMKCSKLVFSTSDSPGCQILAGAGAMVFEEVEEIVSFLHAKKTL
ncbi:DNA-protecting protein DprA [Myxococcota bacterium]|nr:DNA-protecting protein DprA [Myxococcota bacterium]MBU1380957.1 DNA-protecting protein DprA [Myxococcota bacterium]MBU1495765.1 DNA-protecting protein DprA [Myxococcota bacterium]